jgi:cell division protein FtsI (penicillin-binding protein 3)
MSLPVTERSPNDRILLVLCSILAVFVFLGGRLAYLTMIQSEELAAIGERQKSRTLRLAAGRGAIVDRGRRTLAHTVGAPSIFASPRYHKIPEEKLPALAEALELEVESLREEVERDRGFAWLRRHVSREQARAVENLDLAGVRSVVEPRRSYPRGALAAHVLGTAAGAELRGRYGLELRYDRWMRGDETVLRLERDGRGRTILTRAYEDALVEESEEPTPGATLQLTIDARLQAMVERELALGVEKARADAGTAIVLDPITGGVLALANYPSFDPNRPGDSAPELRRNRSVTDPVEPGSTFKPFTFAAALEEGAVGIEDEFDCEDGAYRIGRRTVHDVHRYDLLAVPEVLQYSSNIGTLKIAQALGPQRFATYLRDFGFGSRTGIDLPDESSGIVRAHENWAEIDFANISFGQGIAVTPIQLAAAYGAIANGGELHQPYVLESAFDPRGRKLLDGERAVRRAASRRVMSRDTARSVALMLEKVVAEGTGKGAAIRGVRVAGKTGTAQKVDPETKSYGSQRLASFAGFAPVDDPALVTVLFIDNPRGVTYGGVVAAPVFREITTRALDHLGRSSASTEVAALAGLPSTDVAALGDLPSTDVALGGLPSNDVAGLAALLDDLPRGGVPSFSGVSLRRALEKAGSRGLRVDVRGTGFVRRQEPPPGTPLEGVEVLRLWLEPVA